MIQIVLNNEIYSIAESFNRADRTLVALLEAGEDRGASKLLECQQEIQEQKKERNTV